MNSLSAMGEEIYADDQSFADLLEAYGQNLGKHQRLNASKRQRLNASDGPRKSGRGSCASKFAILGLSIERRQRRRSVEDDCTFLLEIRGCSGPVEFGQKLHIFIVCPIY